MFCLPAGLRMGAECRRKGNADCYDHNTYYGRIEMSRPLAPALGNALPHARLDPDAVRAIRAAGYRKTAKQLADEYGVHYRTIEKVRHSDS